MNSLAGFVMNYTQRGECQCGRCIDKGPDREPPNHSVDMHFFWVAVKDDPKAGEFKALVDSQYPDLERLRAGPSYIEIGGVLGDQGVGIRFIGLGKLLGLWDVLTPKVFGFEGAEADELAGSGMVMCTGYKEAVK